MATESLILEFNEKGASVVNGVIIQITQNADKANISIERLKGNIRTLGTGSSQISKLASSVKDVGSSASGASSRVEGLVNKTNSLGVASTAASKKVANLNTTMVNTSVGATSLTRAAVAVNSITTATVGATRGMTNVSRATQGATNSFVQMRNQIGGISGQLQGMEGLVVAALGSAGIIQSIDAYQRVSNSLRLVTKNQKEFIVAMEGTQRIANETFNAIEGTTSLYRTLAQSTTNLNMSQSKLLNTTEQISQIFAISGGNAESLRAALVQLGQGLGAGALRGQEFNSVMEATNGVFGQFVAKGLGLKTVAQLRELAFQGKLTAEVLINSLNRVAPEIDRAFATMTPTIMQAFTVLRNNVIAYIGESGEASGMTKLLVGSIMALAANVGPAVNALILFGAALVALKIASVVTGVIELTAALVRLAMVMATALLTPAGAMVTILGLAAVAMYMLLSPTEAVASEMQTLGQNGTQALNGVTDATVNTGTQFDVLGSKIKTALQGAMPSAKELEQQMKDIGIASRDTTSRAVTDFNRMGMQATTTVGAIRSTFGQVPGYIQQPVAAGVNGAISEIQRLQSAATGTISNINAQLSSISASVDALVGKLAAANSRAASFSGSGGGSGFSGGGGGFNSGSSFGTREGMGGDLAVGRPDFNAGSFADLLNVNYNLHRTGAYGFGGPRFSQTADVALSEAGLSARSQVAANLQAVLAQVAGASRTGNITGTQASIYAQVAQSAASEFNDAITRLLRSGAGTGPQVMRQLTQIDSGQFYQRTSALIARYPDAEQIATAVLGSAASTLTSSQAFQNSARSNVTSLFANSGGMSSGNQSQSSNMVSLQDPYANLREFRRGGEFRVGGNGGTDSQLVAFKASPNETVSVRRPGQRGSGKGGDKNIDISVQMDLSGVTDAESFKRSEKHILTSLQMKLAQIAEEI